MIILITFGLLGLTFFLLGFQKKQRIDKLKFMDRKFTGILKGIAIYCVILSHVGSTNQLRLVAPLGG